MADNDWYQKHEKDVAAALKKGRAAPKDQAVSCTLVRMKDGAHLLCTSISASKAAALVKEARKAGGKVISAGRLYCGEDGPTFEVDEGDLSVKAKFSTAAVAAQGSPMNVVVIGPPSQAPATAETPADDAGAVLQPSAADMAAVRAALSKLLPAVQQAVKDHPEHKSDLLQLLARRQQHIKDDQAAEAKAVLVDVAKLVKALAAAPAGDEQTEQEVEQTADEQTEQEVEQTSDEQTEQEITEETPTESDEFKELYNGLLETIPGDLRRLREVDPAAADKIQKVVDGAAAHAGKGDFQKAFNYLNQAAEVLAKTAGAGRVKEAAEVIPEGKVEAMKAALTRAQSKWDAAVTAARERLKPVLASLREDFPSAAAGVNNILDSYEQDLLDELRAGQAKADEEGLAAAVRATLEKVQALRAEAAGDDVFSYLHECGVPVKDAFAEAFDEVESILQN